MKKLIPIVVTLLLLVTACSKEEDIENPGWLNEKIEELISDQGLCNITTVTVYEFKGEVYYNIYAALWSCVYCHLYDAEGNLVDLSEEQFEGFEEEKTIVNEFQACE